MYIETLIGKEFLEKELYELLLFDIEENISSYYCNWMHLYFERLADQKIRVTELVQFRDHDELNRADRAMIEKREWFRIDHRVTAIDLLLVRLDRSGFTSVVRALQETHHQDWVLAWADEFPRSGRPLTDEERRQAFLELAGLLEASIQLKKLRTIRAV